MISASTRFLAQPSEIMPTRTGRALKMLPEMFLLTKNLNAVLPVSTADRISVLVYGRVIATGLPAEIRANPEVRHAYLGDEAEEHAAEATTNA